VGRQDRRTSKRHFRICLQVLVAGEGLLGDDSCAIVNGSVLCWGNSSGQVGDGTTTNRFAPVAISGWAQ
jgi:hypothetical protein